MKSLCLGVFCSLVLVATSISAPPPPDYDHDDDDSLMIPGCSAGSRWTLYRNNGKRSDGVEVVIDQADVLVLAMLQGPAALASFFASKMTGAEQEELDGESTATMMTTGGGGGGGGDDSTADDVCAARNGAVSKGGCALYDATAGRLESCRDYPMGSGGGEVWLVPPGRWFVFPSDELGRTVAVPRMHPPPRGVEAPIILETISNSPRVFHIHNFLTFDEADSLVAFSERNTDPVYGLHRSTTGVEHQVAVNRHRTSDNAFDVSSPTALRVKRRALDLL